MPHTTREKLKTAGFALIIVLASALVYLKAAPGDFVWDDAMLVRDNLYVRRIENVKLLFSKEYFAAFRELSYRPVCTLTYLIDYQLWGSKPGGHITNVGLHMLNSLLLFLLVLRVYGRGRPAFGAAGLFALHPIQTEAVAGITFREDLLCMLFVLAAVHFYLSWRREGGRWMIPMALSFILAVLSKETAVVLPAAVTVMELAPPFSKDEKRPGWRGAGALWALAGVYLALRFLVFRGPAEQVVYHGGGLLETAKLSLAALQCYLELVELKFNQCIIYPTEAITNFNAASWALAGLHAILFAAWLIFFRRSRLTWGLAWFFLFLLPVSNIIPIAVVMADRYLYIPLAGLAAAAALLVEKIVAGGADSPGRIRANAYLIIMLLAMLALFTRSQSRCLVWLDERSLWQSATACAPGSAYAHNNLGKAYYDHLLPEFG
ncbi:MAG: glycosyltransferase family 39 protein, partial [bacterium]